MTLKNAIYDLHVVVGAAYKNWDIMNLTMTSFLSIIEYFNNWNGVWAACSKTSGSAKTRVFFNGLQIVEILNNALCSILQEICAKKFFWWEFTQEDVLNTEPRS